MKRMSFGASSPVSGWIEYILGLKELTKTRVPSSGDQEMKVILLLVPY